MHDPSRDLRAAIDRAEFDELRRTHPVYGDDPSTVIVDPETFDNTPKLTGLARLARLPFKQPVAGSGEVLTPEQEQAIARRKTAQFMHLARAKAKRRSQAKQATASRRENRKRGK